MKTLITISLIVTAFSIALAEEEKSSQTLGERTAATLSKVGEKTKDTGRLIADTTKNAAAVVVDAVTPDSDARKVVVRLNEHQIDMPISVKPGKTAFIVHNAGTEKHNFEIEGQGIEKTFMIGLSPDQTKVLHADLKPGHYRVFCPMKNHSTEGMRVSLTVK